MVGFFVGNDFESPGRKPYEYSYLATLANALWRLRDARTPAAGGPDGRVAGYDDNEPSLTLDKFLEIAVNRSWIYETDSDRLATAAALAGGHLREMRDIANRAGADLLVVLLPDEAQVDAALQEEVLRTSGRARDALDFEAPSRAMARELSRHGVATLDLLPDFQREGRHTRLYKTQDTHWNVAGNRLAASVIAAALRDRVQGVGRTDVVPAEQVRARRATNRAVRRRDTLR
jgi:hypothetical protein